MGAGAAAVIGGGFNGIGQAKQSQDQMAALEENKNLYYSQADYVDKVGQRKASLLQRSQAQELGKQKAQFAKSGVSFDGSVIDFLADTTSQQKNELNAVNEDTQRQSQSLRMKAARAQSQQDDIANWAVFNSVGSFFGGSSKYIGASETGSKDAGST